MACEYYEAVTAPVMNAVQTSAFSVQPGLETARTRFAPRVVYTDDCFSTGSEAPGPPFVLPAGGREANPCYWIRFATENEPRELPFEAQTQVYTEGCMMRIVNDQNLRIVEAGLREACEGRSVAPGEPNPRVGAPQVLSR